MCKSGYLNSFPQISAWNVRCHQSVEALEFSFHSVWETEACAKPLSWSAWLFFSVHVEYLHAFLQTHAEWSQQIRSCASKWLKENGGRAWFCQSVFQMLLYLHAAVKMNNWWSKSTNDKYFKYMVIIRPLYANTIYHKHLKVQCVRIGHHTQDKQEAVFHQSKS